MAKQGYAKFFGGFRHALKKNLSFKDGYEHRANTDDIRILADQIEQHPLQPDDKFSFSEYSKTIVNDIWF